MDESALGVVGTRVACPRAIKETHLRVEVLAERDGRADDATEIEDRPEDGDKLALLTLRWVCEHQRTLRGPEEAGGHAQDRPCANDISPRVRVDIDDTSISNGQCASVRAQRMWEDCHG